MILILTSTLLNLEFNWLMSSFDTLWWLMTPDLIREWTLRYCGTCKLTYKNWNQTWQFKVTLSLAGTVLNLVFNWLVSPFDTLWQYLTFSLNWINLKSNLIISKNFEFSRHTAEFGIQLAREPFRHSLTGYGSWF